MYTASPPEKEEWSHHGVLINRVFQDISTFMQEVISYICVIKSSYKHISDFGWLRIYGIF